MTKQQLLAPLLAVLIGATASLGTVAAEKVYKWVDEDGVVHFGQQPPPAPGVEAIEVRKGYSTQEEAGEAPTEAELKAAEEAEFCRMATHNFEALSGTGDVKRRDEYGQERILTADEKTTERERAQAAMEKYCPPAAAGTP